MFHVQCETDGGKVVLNLEVIKYSTIRYLKLAISANAGFPSSYRLKLSYLAAVLTDESTIEECGIKEDGLIRVDVTPLPGDPEFQILVQYKDKFQVVKVKETSTVEDLKNEVTKIWDIPANRVTLTHHNLGVPMEDGPLMYYYVCAGSVIDVVKQDDEG